MANLQLKDGNGTLYNFRVSGDGSEGNPFIPLSDLSIAGAPITGANPLPVSAASPLPIAAANALPTTGQSDTFFRRLFRTLSRLSFDVSGQLRTAVAGSVSVSSGTVTTVTTMTTGNIGFSDMGKPATAMIVSRQMAAVSTKANLRRP